MFSDSLNPAQASLLPSSQGGVPPSTQLLPCSRSLHPKPRIYSKGPMRREADTQKPASWFSPLHHLPMRISVGWRFRRNFTRWCTSLSHARDLTDPSWKTADYTPRSFSSSPLHQNPGDSVSPPSEGLLSHIS